MTIERVPFTDASDFTIGNCHATYACPQLWSKLTETADALVRDCRACARMVYLCSNPDEVAAQVKAGNCIAFGLAPDGERAFIGEMKAHYATGDVLTWPEQKELKIAPSSFDQKVDLNSTDWM